MPGLVLRSLVTPDDCRSYDIVFFIQQNCSMHLAGEANAGNLVCAGGGLTQDLADGQNTGAPPVAGILLGPPRMRNTKRLVILRNGRKQIPILIHNYGAGPAGSDIDAQELDSKPPLNSTQTASR